VATARISAKLTALPARDLTRITQLFEQAGLPTHARLKSAQITRLLGAMKLDKKVSDGEIRFVLARRVGEVVTGQKVPGTIIETALDIAESTI
jgi:3-dehydroquinate synthase